MMTLLYVTAILTLPAIKYISRLSTFVLIPCLIINALGSALSLQLLTRMGITIPFSIFITLLSYAIGYCLKFIHEDCHNLFMASLVAVGSPNSISLPLMVMQALCEESTVNADYDHNADNCYEEATSVMFIYSIGWHICFWGYSYSVLSSMGESNLRGTSCNTVDLWTVLVNGSARKQAVIRCISWLKNLLSTPSMVAIYVGLTVGLLPTLQNMMFERISPLRPLGGAITTLGEPVVAINCLIMSASLAHADIDISALTSQCKAVAASLSRSLSSQRRWWLRRLPRQHAAGPSRNGDEYADLSDDEEADKVQRSEQHVELAHINMHSQEQSGPHLLPGTISAGPVQAPMPDLTESLDCVAFSCVGNDSDSRSSVRPSRAWSRGSDWSADGGVITEEMDAALGVVLAVEASTQTVPVSEVVSDCEVGDGDGSTECKFVD